MGEPGQRFWVQMDLDGKRAKTELPQQLPTLVCRVHLFSALQQPFSGFGLRWTMSQENNFAVLG